ncbi:hypothetical protein J7T55_012007 [Diaporthe amygdali]|uniref:uncharacterized protein n=1 Tax=Phomopsis amygdali TaxID=1214568 RepID=UPI0022FE961A|nr:uncharacterized protein J7T55_012007 [Diaporthe amygdali]KAJ0123542.1 hypothetical protein J7T55_012007 [Diaporthe amygdali]
MDVHVVKEFANTLLIACQGRETGIISTQRLIEPGFLAAFSAILREPLAKWTNLPPQLQEVIQDALHANGWRHDIFEGNVEMWMQHEMDSPLEPQEDVATRLYDKLRGLPNPRTPLERAMRQVYFVELHHLRKTFLEYFTSHNREPLMTYISNRLGLEAETVRSVCKETAYAGERLDAIAGFQTSSAPAILTTPRLEKKVSKTAPEFDAVVRSLAAQGVSRNESTQIYYELAERFFERRRKEGIRLAESLCQGKKSTMRSAGTPWKRVSINDLLKSKTHGGTQSAESDLQHRNANRMMPRDAARAQNVPEAGPLRATAAHDTSGAATASHHQNRTKLPTSRPGTDSAHVHGKTTLRYKPRVDREITDLEEIVQEDVAYH